MNEIEKQIRAGDYSIIGKDVYYKQTIAIDYEETVNIIEKGMVASIIIEPLNPYNPKVETKYVFKVWLTNNKTLYSYEIFIDLEEAVNYYLSTEKERLMSKFKIKKGKTK